MSSSELANELPEAEHIPTLRSIKDIHGEIDLEKVINLGTLYTLGVNNGNEEHMARMGEWHPSSTGYCKMAQVLQYTGTPPTDRQPKSLKEIFELGHAIHDLVQTRLEGLGPVAAEHGLKYEFQREVKFDKKTDKLFREFGIGGTTDGILRLWNAHFEQSGIVEIKSQSDDRHTKLLEMKHGWPTHLMQAHLYAFRFDQPIIWLFYVNKNNSKREIRLQLFDEKIFNEAIEYFIECGDYVDRGVLPAREESWFECSSCVYRTMCDPKVLKRKPKYPSVPLVQIRRHK